MPHLLIVDNDAAYTYVTERYLRQAGHTVSVAHTGETGFVIAQSEPVDLLIVDFRLPGIDGVELIRLIRKKKEALPAIVCTAFIENARTQQIGDARTVLIEKDAGTQALLDAVTALLDRRGG